MNENKTVRELLDEVSAQALCDVLAKRFAMDPHDDAFHARCKALSGAQAMAGRRKKLVVIEDGGGGEYRVACLRGVSGKGKPELLICADEHLLAMPVLLRDGMTAAEHLCILILSLCGMDNSWGPVQYLKRITRKGTWQEE